MDAGVAVAVGDVDVAVGGPDGGGGGPVEGLAAPLGSGMVAFADFHNLFAVGGEFLDGVDAVIGGEDGVVVGNVEAVGAVAEKALAEGADKVAVRDEDHNGVFAAGEDKDAVLGVADHAGTFHEAHPVGEFEPVRDEGVLEIAVAEGFRHSFSSCGAGFVVLLDCPPYYITGQAASNDLRDGRAKEAQIGACSR